jgi:hypothetical protein
VYNVSSDFNDAFAASHRKILAKVTISYSDPDIDPSLEVVTSESARITQTMQIADVNEDTIKKYASLDGSWILNGLYFLCPETAEQAISNQMGWWGSSVSGAGGSFSVPYPSVTISFSVRNIKSFIVCGDGKRMEHPVDFVVEFYSGVTLLHTCNITANTQISRVFDINKVENVDKMILTITKWSHVGRQVKIVEFFPIITETYYGDDLLLVHLLEEREFSTGSLPIGNISANEITVRVVNEDNKFDSGNIESPVYNLVRPNRRIKSWIGIELPDQSIEWVPLGTFWSGEWAVSEQDQYAETTGRDRLELMTRRNFNSRVYQSYTFYDLAQTVLDDCGYPSWIDEELKDFTVPYAYFEDMTHRECLRVIAEASLSQVYVDRDGTIRVEGASYQDGVTESSITIDNDLAFTRNNPMIYGQIANYIEIETQPLMPSANSQEIYRSDNPEIIDIGETKTLSVIYSEKPCIDVVASLEGQPSGTTISAATYYSWGAEITVSGASTSGTFTLVINGKPLSVQGSQKLIVKDDTSIKQNGKQSYVFAKNPLIQTAEIALAIAQKCLALSKLSKRDVETQWTGNPALLLGDRITVPDSNSTTADFLVTSQEIEFDGGLTMTTKAKKVIS